MSVKAKSFFVGSVAFVLYMMMRNIIPLRNMTFFVVACVIFVGVMLLSYCLLKQINMDLKPTAQKVWSISAIVLLAIWMILFYVNETKPRDALSSSALIRRYFPFPLWITLMLVGTAVCLLLLHKGTKETTWKIRKKIRVVVSLLFTFGTAIQFYAPNIFLDEQGGTYHSHAYTNSIINVCWMTPYSKNMETLYGHYGIIFMPVVRFLHKFFRIDLLTGIFIVCACLMAGTILLFLYVLNFFVKDELIYYLGMLAIGEEYFMLMQGGVYLQLHPHRMVFPMLLVAFALWEYKRKKKYNVIAVALITLSFVWSTEVGLVVACAFALYRWIARILDEKKLSVRKCLWLLYELAIYLLLPFALAYIVVNIYNLAAGGAVLDFKEFMYPVISDRNYLDRIQSRLPDASHAWTGATILFMGAVCPAVFEIFFPSKEKKEMVPFVFLLGVMNLGVMLYYVNGAAEGCLFIVLFLMLILQGAFLQRCQNVYQQWKVDKTSVFDKPNQFVLLAFRIITVFILFVMAFDCVYSMPGAWKKSSKTIWKRDELVEFTQHIYYQIPPNAVSFGEGVPELMSMIERDTHLHTTEWSYLNMPLDTMEEIQYELEKEHWFFCSLYSLHFLEDNFPGLTDDYVLHEEFDYNGDKFAFFVKEE